MSLLRRGKILGLSKMLVRSLILAVAGSIAYLLFSIVYRRKLALLEARKLDE